MKKVIFGVLVSLFAINANAALIKMYEADTYLHSIAGSRSVINGSGGADTSFDSGTIFFDDTGRYGAAAFPGGHDTTFVLTATGYVDTSLYSALKFSHDDGFTASIAGSSIYTFDANTSLMNSGWIPFADTGLQSFDLLFWENQGYATLLVYGQLRDTQISEVAHIASVSGIAPAPGSVPAPSSFLLLGLALIVYGTYRRIA